MKLPDILTLISNADDLCRRLYISKLILKLEESVVLKFESVDSDLVLFKAALSPRSLLLFSLSVLIDLSMRFSLC